VTNEPITRTLVGGPLDGRVVKMNPYTVVAEGIVSEGGYLSAVHTYVLVNGVMTYREPSAPVEKEKPLV
jgi:hypothetical protein